MPGRCPIESEIVHVALGGPCEPPVDLLQVARDVKVGDIRSTRFRSGFTDFGSDFPIIYVSQVALGTTKRFILAHEIAHVILRMPEVLLLMRVRGKTSLLNDEETLADRIAATILVPDSWVESLRGTRCTTYDLRQTAQRADISVMTLVRRMASSGIDVALLHWRRGNDFWRIIDRPGTPPGLHGYVRPTLGGQHILDRLQGEDATVIIECSINGRRAKIAGHAYRRGEHAFHLLEPSIDVWIAQPEQ